MDELRTVTELVCLRCNHRWLPKKVQPPIQCPGCRSPYWNIPRQVREKKEEGK